MKVTAEQRIEGGERGSHEETGWKEVPGRENIEHNEPEVGTCWNVQEILSTLWLPGTERGKE